MLAKEGADGPGGVCAEVGAVVEGPAGRDEDEIVCRYQERFQHEVGQGADQGVDEKPVKDEGEFSYSELFQSQFQNGAAILLK